jgi:hypothetical protein
MTTILCGAAGFVLAFRMPPLFLAGNMQLAQSPFTDYHREQPGTIHKIKVADLPEPYRTQSADNRPHIVARPADAWPKANRVSR